MNNNDYSNTEIRNYHYGVAKRLYIEAFPHRRKPRSQIINNICQELGVFGMKQHE